MKKFGREKLLNKVVRIEMKREQDRLKTLCARTDDIIFRMWHVDMQATFARWRKVAAQYRRLSLVGGKSLHNAGGFRSLAEGCCTVQEAFARWQKVCQDLM
jgi:choline dehydrogenase-like flavoprotein